MIWLVNARYGKEFVGAESYATGVYERLAGGNHLRVRADAAILCIRRGRRTRGQARLGRRS